MNRYKPGNRVGPWEVIECLGADRWRAVYYVVRCALCGAVKPKMREDHLTATRKNRKCIQCARERVGPRDAFTRTDQALCDQHWRSIDVHEMG